MKTAYFKQLHAYSQSGWLFLGSEGLLSLSFMIPPDSAQANTLDHIRAWSSTDTDDNSCVVREDWEGDGNFNLVVGNNNGQRNQIYRSANLRWQSYKSEAALSD